MLGMLGRKMKMDAGREMKLAAGEEMKVDAGKGGESGCWEGK